VSAAARLAGRATPVVWLVAATTAIRLVYAAVADPLGGPDSQLYHDAAGAMADRGIGARDVPGVPWAPAGYPAFLAVLYEVLGSAPRLAVAAQILLVGAATLSAHALVARELGPRTALVAVVLLCASPALLDASATIMYEPGLGAGLVFGLDLVSRAARRPGALGMAAGGGGILGLAATMQPKVLLTGALAVCWLAARGRRWTPALACALALALAPAGLALRNQAATGHLALSANGGENTFSIAWKVPGTDLRPSLQAGAECRRLAARSGHRLGHDEVFDRNARLFRCAVRWARSHPGGAARVATFNALSFWAPAFEARDPGWLRTASLIAGALWTAATLLLLVAGAAAGLRAAPWGTALLLAPTLSFLATTMVTVGDPRYRLPVAFFYLPLVALGLITAARRVAGGRRPARPSPAARSRFADPPHRPG